MESRPEADGRDDEAFCVSRLRSHAFEASPLDLDKCQPRGTPTPTRPHRPKPGPSKALEESRGKNLPQVHHQADQQSPLIQPPTHLFYIRVQPASLLQKIKRLGKMRRTCEEKPPEEQDRGRNQLLQNQPVGGGRTPPKTEAARSSRSGTEGERQRAAVRTLQLVLCSQEDGGRLQTWALEPRQSQQPGAGQKS